MGLKFGLIFIAFASLLSSFTYASVDYNFEGDWYIVEHPNNSDAHWFTYWKITDQNKVHAYHPEPEFSVRLKIVKQDDNHFILNSEYFRRPIKIGNIVTRKDDEVTFSSGLKMIRITDKTESFLNFDELEDFFHNSNWSYEWNDKVTTLYLSDSLNVYGFGSADIILTKAEDFNYSNSGLGWSLETFNGQFVFSHSTYFGRGVTIFINQLSKNYFSGRLFWDMTEIPIVAQRISQAEDYQIEAIESIITKSVWHSQPIIHNKIDELTLGWNGMTKFKTFENVNVDDSVFSFFFMPDRVMQIYMGGKYLDSNRWRISNDGSYLIVHSHQPFLIFSSELNYITDNPHKMSITLDFMVDSNDLQFYDDYIKFDLSAQ